MIWMSVAADEKSATEIDNMAKFAALWDEYMSDLDPEDILILDILANTDEVILF
jgi:hypothetical protein